MEWFEGICMMCHKSPIEVRHINLYPSGSEGLFCCRSCEDKLLEFIRGKGRKAVEEKIKNLRKKDSIKRWMCVVCKKPAIQFKDDVSFTEWCFTGFCQKCQDGIFIAKKEGDN